MDTSSVDDRADEFGLDDIANDSYNTHPGPRHRDDALRAELGLQPLPRSTTTSPARASALATSRIRDMWLHESATNLELRRLLDAAAATSSTYLEVMAVGVDVCAAKSAEDLSGAVSRSDRLMKLLKCNRVTLFIATSGMLRAFGLDSPAGLVAPMPKLGFDSGPLASALAARPSFHTADSVVLGIYAQETGRQWPSEVPGAVLAVPLLSASGDLLGLLDCVRSEPFTVDEEVIMINIGKFLQGALARYAHGAAPGLRHTAQQATAIDAYGSALNDAAHSAFRAPLRDGSAFEHTWLSFSGQAAALTAQLCGQLSDHDRHVSVFFHGDVFPCPAKVSQSAADASVARIPLVQLWMLDPAVRAARAVAVNTSAKEPRGVLRSAFVTARPQTACPAARHTAFDLSSDTVAGISADKSVFAAPLIGSKGASARGSMGVLVVTQADAFTSEEEAALAAFSRRLSACLEQCTDFHDLGAGQLDAVLLRARLTALLGFPALGEHDPVAAPASLSTSGFMSLSRRHSIGDDAIASAPSLLTPTSVHSRAELLLWCERQARVLLGATAVSIACVVEQQAGAREPLFQLNDDVDVVLGIACPSVPSLAKRCIERTGHVLMTLVGGATDHTVSRIAQESRHWLGSKTKHGSIACIASHVRLNAWDDGSDATNDRCVLVIQAAFAHAGPTPTAVTNDAHLLKHIALHVKRALGEFEAEHAHREAVATGAQKQEALLVFERVLGVQDELLTAAMDSLSSLVAACARVLPKAFGCRTALLFVPDDDGRELWSSSKRPVDSGRSVSPIRTSDGLGSPSRPIPLSPSRGKAASSLHDHHSARLTVTPGHGIIGSCFASKATVALDEQRLSSMDASLDGAIAAFRPKNMLCVPLLGHSRLPSGVLVLLDHAGDGFSAEDIRAAELLVAHVSSLLRQHTRHAEPKVVLASTQQALLAAREEVIRLTAALAEAKQEADSARRTLHEEQQAQAIKESKRKSFHEWIQSGPSGRRRSLILDQPVASPAPAPPAPPLRIIPVPPPAPWASAATGKRLGVGPPPPPPRSPTVSLASSPLRRAKVLPPPPASPKRTQVRSSSPPRHVSSSRSTSPSSRSHGHSPAKPRRTSVSISVQANMSPAGVAVQTSPMQRQEARAVVSAIGAAPSPRRADSPFRASAYTREPASPQSFRTTVLPSSPRGKSVGTARAGRRVSIEDMLALSALVHDTHDDDNALFGKAMHQLRDLLDADRAVLYLLDVAEGVLWTPVADGGSVLKVPVGTGLVGHAAASGDIVSVADVHADPRFDEVADVLCGQHTRSALCVPLKSTGRVVAVVQALDKAAGAPFTEDDVVLTKLAGTQIVSVLRNREDYQAAIKAHKHASAELSAMHKRVRRESITSINLADQSTKLRVLLNFSALSAAVNDVGSLVTLVCKDAASVLDAHATALYLADSNATRLTSITAEPEDSGIAFGEGIVGHVAAHHAAVQWNAQMASSPDLTTAEVQQLGIRPMYVLTVPLRDAHDHVAGVFQIARGVGGRGFSSDDEATAMELAAQVLAACTRVRLATSSREQMHKALNEIATLQHALKQAESAFDGQSAVLGHRWETCQAVLRDLSLGGFDRATVFDVTADVLRRATSSQFAQLFILASDPPSEDSSEHGVSLLAHTSKGYRSFPLDALTLGAVTVSGEPASLIQHADEFWSWDKSSLSAPVRGKFHVMLHPLLDAAGKVYGVVQVARKKEKTESSEYTQEDHWLLAVLAEHIRTIVDASNAILALQEDRENLVHTVDTYAERMSEQQKHTSVIDSITGVSEALAAADSSQQISTILSETLPRLLSCEAATLFIVDKDTNELYAASPYSAASTSARSPSPSKRVSKGISSPSRTQPSRLPISRGIIGATAATGKLISVSEAYDDPRFHPFEKTVDKLRSVLCIPVTNRRGEVVAVLQLCNKAGSTMFSVDDTGLAERVVSRISVALERCQSVEYTNQRVRRVTVELSEIQARTLQLESLYEQSTDEFIKTAQAVRKIMVSVDAAFTTSSLLASVRSELTSAMAVDYVRLFFVDHARKELIGYDPSISHAPRTSLLDSSAASAVASKQVTTADVPSGQLWLTDSEMTTFPTALHVATLPVIGFDGVCIGVLQVGKRQSAPSFTTVQLTVLDSIAFMFRVVLESSHALTANEEALTAAKQQLQETQSISSQMEIRLRQAREAEQAHRQLYPLAIMLSSVESNRGLVSALHRHGPAVLHVAAAHLFLIDGATGDLVSQSEDSSGSRHTADVRIPLHDSLLGAVAKSGEVTTLTSPATDARWHDAERAVLQVRGLASLQITPVTDVSGSVQGVLVLCNKLGDEFMYSDQSAASFLAAFISAVLLRLHHRPTQALTAKQDGGSVSRFYSSDLGLSKSVGQIEQALSTSGHHTHISAGHTDAVSAHDKRFKHKAMRLLSICQKQEKTIAAMLLTFHHCLSDRVFAIACLHVRDIIGAAHVTYYTVGSACVPTSTSEASTHGSTHGLNAVALSSQHPVAAAAVSGLPVNHADGRVGSSASSVSPTKRLTASQAGQVGCITVPVCSRAGKSYVLGVIEATCQPGKSFTADDERLVGAVASQLAFVIERREASSSVETLAKTGTRSTAEWRAMLAEKSAIIEDLQTRLDRATLAPSSSTESRVDRRELNELRSRYEEQTATLERLEKKLMESGRSELEHRERLSASQHERDGAQAALDATRQQLFATSNALEELRIEYEGLLSRHSALQGRMDQLVSLSASAATLSQSDL